VDFFNQQAGKTHAGSSQRGPNAPAARADDAEIIFRLDHRLGSGDSERKTLLTRQITFEPLPASVLLTLG
jgi:hypothetical protein